MCSKLFGLNELKIYSDREFLVYRTNHDEKSYSYYEIISTSERFLDFITKIGMTRTRISIQCPHCPELCVILLSILNNGSSFCPILQDANENELLEATRRYGSSYLISNKSHSVNNNFLQLVERTKILNAELYIYKMYNDSQLKEDIIPDECYCIQTSGSTGIPKVVRVPYQCITPNITGLRTTLCITSEDVIFMSSPITFDPFVVEFFLALRNGACLLIADPDIRIIPQKLVDILQPMKSRGATVIQMTPSLFRLFGLNNIQRIILGANTTIRILLLGGEAFPTLKEISTWTTENHNKTRIFNIYGITEVSCWSTLYEIQKSNSGKRIPIGHPIDSETLVRLVDDMGKPLHQGTGNIQIGSTSRKCVVGDENWKDISTTEFLFRTTEDTGSISEGTIFYEGRKSDMIKRYGTKVHLEHMRNTILKVNGVLNSLSVFNGENMQLICFVIGDDNKSKDVMRKDILQRLKDSEKPDDIEFVDAFPLTPHGKISKNDLLHLYDTQRRETPIKTFEKFLTNILCLNLGSQHSGECVKAKREKVSLDISFLEAGGTSFQALGLSTQIEQILGRPEPKLLEMLLNETTTISVILEFLSNINCGALTTRSMNISLHTKVPNDKELLKILWKYDTGKCVDATPRCYKNVVCVGSHSHLLAALDSRTGCEISKCALPNRIECQVTFVDDEMLLVGCYDGQLYAVDFSCGKIKWQFNCGGMIKAKPLINDDRVVIGNYSINGNLLCLNLKERNPLWKVQVGTKGIFASLIQIDTETLLACTLSGDAACVKLDSGQIVWRTIFKSPIFSTPVMLTKDLVLVAEVRGIVHCLNSKSGKQIWNFKTDGNIFSSLIVHTLNDYEKFIFFGNHDWNIYCLKSTQPAQQACIAWKSTLDSAVYSTPTILAISAGILTVVACSTMGSIYILDFVTGSIFFTMNLDSEIFSSPCVVQNRIYVGCRSNHLVCLEVNRS